MRRTLVPGALVVLGLTVSCGPGGGVAPMQPSPPTPPSGLTTWTFEGRIVSNPDHAPVGSAVVQPAATGTSAATADAAGQFSVRIASVGDPVVTITAPGAVERRTTFSGSRNRSGLLIDLISMAAPFSLDFYRQLARNAYDAPDGPLQPIRRWEEQPNFYIKTTDQDGTPVEQARVDKVIANIRNIVPQATAGHFEAGAIETGPDDRPRQAGWIRVLFRSDPDFSSCGTATVGANPGEVNLSLSCFGDPIGGPLGNGPTAAVVTHEVGHAMGLWHVAQGLMGRGGPGLQPGVSPPQLRYDLTDQEKYHAAIIYSRPVGNTDPDVDPFDFRFLRASAPAPVVQCVLTPLQGPSEAEASDLRCP